LSLSPSGMRVRRPWAWGMPRPMRGSLTAPTAPHVADVSLNRCGELMSRPRGEPTPFGAGGGQLPFQGVRVAIYFLIFLLYVFSVDARVTSSYHISLLAYSSSLLNGSTRLPQDVVYRYFPTIVDVVPLDSGFIAAHSAGFVFWSLASTSISRFIGLERGPPYFGSLFVLNILSALVGTLSVIYVERIARLYLKPQDAVAVAFSYAVGSIAWVYSSIAYSQSFAAPFIAIGLYYLLVYLRFGRLRHLLLTGVFYSIATYSDHTLAVLGLSVLIVIIVKKRAVPVREILSYLCCYTFLLIPVVAYYIWITGSPTPTQTLYSTHLGLKPLDMSRIVLELSLTELLFGLRKSLLITTPALLTFSLCSFFYIKNIGSMERSELTYALTVFLLETVLYSSWYDWHGGLSYGPRLLYSILPLLSVAASVSLKSGNRVSLFLCLSNVGAIFNIAVISTNPFSCAYQDLIRSSVPQVIACNLPLLTSRCYNPTLLGSLGFSCASSLLLLLSIVLVINLLLYTNYKSGRTSE